MRLLFLEILTLCVLSPAHAIDTILPSNVIDFSDRIHQDVHTREPGILEYNIYNFEADEENIYSTVGTYDQLGAGIGFIPEYYHTYFGMYLINRNTESVSFLSPQYVKPGTSISNRNFMIGEAIYSSITTPLEEASSPQYKVEIENSNPVYVYYYTSRISERIILGQTNHLIAGLIAWSTKSWDSHDFEFTYTANVWNMEGKRIWSENLCNVQKEKNMYGLPSITELRFSPKGKFFVANLCGSNGNRGQRAPFAPCSFSYLINLETFEILPANRDVAFTSDERYYVTERDGYPALVDASTHEVQHYYDLKGYISSCCFSPDEQTLFIASDTLKIYQYESHLPDTSVDDWILYE